MIETLPNREVEILQLLKCRFQTSQKKEGDRSTEFVLFNDKANSLDTSMGLPLSCFLLLPAGSQSHRYVYPVKFPLKKQGKATFYLLLRTEQGRELAEEMMWCTPGWKGHRIIPTLGHRCSAGILCPGDSS